MIFSFYFPILLASQSWAICPADDLYFPFPPPTSLACEPNAVFVPTFISLPVVGTVNIRPIQLHGLAYGFFASLLAPFGGFFASAIKRAYKIKDFESLFPGHGGVMDRMDCQLFMAGFTAVHFYSTIAPLQKPSIDKLLYLFSSLSGADQKLLLQEVGTIHSMHFHLKKTMR